MNVFGQPSDVVSDHRKAILSRIRPALAVHMSRLHLKFFYEWRLSLTVCYATYFGIGQGLAELVQPRHKFFN
jgi:hypothetical protein